MKYFAIAALASAATAIGADELKFLNYVARYNKVYEEIEEFAVRLEQFVHWDGIINDHNYSNDSKNFNLGHNQFSDWTDKEYASILNFGRGETDASEEKRVQDFDKVSDFDEPNYPDYVNWVEKGAVTLVKD